MAKIKENLTELIGGTPLLRLHKVTAGLPADVVVKLGPSTLREASRTASATP